jgi:hypothetical protein
VTLGLSVHEDVAFTVSVTSAKSMAANHAVMQQLECIYHAIRSEVPKGAPVFTKDQLWAHQRLTELSTLWAVPQAKRADAQYWLTLVSAHGHCGGLELKVRRI